MRIYSKLHEVNNRGDSITLEEANVLNEVYFGDQVISHIQNQLSKFRAKWIGKSFDPKINVDPELIKFNRLIEDQFGYGTFCMNIDPNNDINAYMLNVGVFAERNYIDTYSKNLKVYKGNKGFYYDKKAGVAAICVMLYGILAEPEITDREVLAVILHEIGHSFTSALLGSTGCISSSNFLMGIIDKIGNLIKDNLSTSRNLDDSKIEKDVDSSNIPVIVSALGQMTNMMKNNPINTFISSVSNTLKKRMNKNTKASMYGYTDEKMADTFSSMYGYSADLNTVLEKMHKLYVKFYTYGKNFKKPGAIGLFLKVTSLKFNGWLAFVLNAKDEHPDGLTRIKVQIDFLERELRKNVIDPKMRAAIQNQINEQKKLIDDYINYSGDPDGMEAYRKYYTYLYKKYGGDIRESIADNEAIFDTLDNAAEHAAL